MADSHTPSKNRQNIARARPVSKRTKTQREIRAQWTAREMIKRRLYTYASMTEAIRDRFDCGIQQSEVIYRRAKEIIAAKATDIDATTLIEAYWNIHDRALADRKYVAASKQIERIAAMKGLLVRKLEVDLRARISIQQTAHLSVLALTPIERMHRERELLARAGLAGLDDTTIDEMVAQMEQKVLGEGEIDDVLDAISLADDAGDDQPDDDGADEVEA